jgi:hypothetical protein
MSEYDSLMIDGENVDPRAISYELADEPDLYVQATEDLDTSTYEYNRVAEENYATLMSGGEPTDEEGEREATLRHKTEVLSAAIDPTVPDPVETPRDLNSPEEQRKTQRAAHELQGLVADLINDIRIDYFNKEAGATESREHMARRDQVAEILREYPGLSDQIEQRLGQYKKSDESHYDSTDADTGDLKKGKLTVGEETYIAARDKDISRDPFAGSMTTVAEIKRFIDANKAEGKHVVKAEEYADVDAAISGGLQDIMNDTGYYQYDKGQGKDPADFYRDDIERENATQELLHSEMVEALYEWREGKEPEDGETLEETNRKREAVVYSKMMAMHKHMAELNEQAVDVVARHSYHDTLRGQRERMMQSILSTRYMREQVRISETARLTPGAMDFHGRRPVGYNADKSIDLGGINLYPDGILGLPGAGGRDKDGNPVTLYIHPDGERTTTKLQPFPMDELPVVVYTRAPEPEVPPVDATGMNVLERRRAEKQYKLDVEARKQRELAHLQEIADGRILEDDRDIATLVRDYNEADRHLFANQADRDAIEDFREVTHIARKRISEALQVELTKAYPNEDNLAEMQRLVNQMTYRLNVTEANHTDKKYAMAPDGTIATRDTVNQHKGYWMIRQDGSARQITRDPATGRRLYGSWMPPTGDYISSTY